MLYIKKLDDGVEIFKALGSELRIQILKLLLEQQEMNMNELATLSRHNIPVIEVVVNNHVLGMVRQWQTLFYGKRYSNTVLQDQADFVKVAEALGVKGIRVTKKEEMGPAIREAIEGGKPALIDVWIDCDEKVFPMVPAGAPIEDVFDAEDLAKKEQEKD